MPCVFTYTFDGAASAFSVRCHRPLRLRFNRAFAGSGVFRFCGLNRLNILTYSPAERFHEKSTRMPFFCSRVQIFLLRYAASAARSASNNARG